MKILAIYFFVLVLLYWNRTWLLYVWVAASPFISNLIVIRNDNPFFGSYRIVDYEGYSSGPAKRLIELFDFDRIVLLLLFLIVLKKFRRPADPSVVRVQRWLGFFGLTVFVSALYSHNVLNALRKATDTFGLCFIAFLIGRTYLTDRKIWSRFLSTILLLGAILGSLCIIEYHKFGDWNLSIYGDAYRVTGPFRYWETLGMTLAIVSFVVWFRWVTTTGPRLKLRQAAYLAIGALLIYGIFRTQTRTIMLALGVGGFMLLFLARGVVMSRAVVKRVMLIAILGGIFILLAPEFLAKTRFYQATISRVQTKEGRAETYIAAWRMFYQNPLMGIGLKNFQDDMKLYVSAQEITHSSLERSSCHSSYFVTAAECGLMGLIPLICFIGAAFAMCRKYLKESVESEDKAWAIAMLGMSITFFLCGITFDPFFDPTMQNQLFCMCLGGTAARLEALTK